MLFDLGLCDEYLGAYRFLYGEASILLFALNVLYVVDTPPPYLLEDHVTFICDVVS